MSASILPFSLAKSNEKLTDRGAIAMVDEFGKAIGLPEKVDRELPAPGSNRGIEPSGYVRTLIYHFSEGGRHIEEIRQIKTDEGFRSLIDPSRMPGPDAVGDWLRRMGAGDRQEQLRSVNDRLVCRYLENELEQEGGEKPDVEGQDAEGQDAEERGSGKDADSKALTLDVDATIIEADKGDGKKAYDGTVGYQPMLGFLSDGRRRPCCSYVKFRPGNASPQTGIEEAIRHTLELVESTGRSLRYFRSDSAAYQSGVIDLLNDENVSYTVTADLDEAVRKAINAVPEESWQPLEDRDGFKTGREASETVHTMNDSDYAFRLIIWREQVEDPSLFAVADEDFYRYGAVITNVPEKEMSTEEVLHHHRGRGNAERFIGEAKSGVGLRHLPCGQERANRIWFAVGMLTFNLLKLMQQQVLPTGWKRRTIRMLRQKALRLVGKVTKSARQLTLKVRASLDQIDRLRTVRRLIYQLA
jgi:hypothetical protein